MPDRSVVPSTAIPPFQAKADISAADETTSMIAGMMERARLMAYREAVFSTPRQGRIHRCVV
ncbi:hypothetical protein [Granulicella mallensis]|uniref:Uncharacterized protein n=1 Tax=Granulicella mallensis TaxID=940614 RepID=A0A7W7ZNG6_9BACT|nr:hypothetical protein [Granulicella mallensis]MBB5063231.1 hypothetical protein [Granulicella mallensis]